MATIVQIPSDNNHYIHALWNDHPEKLKKDDGQTLVIMIHGFPGHKDIHGGVFEDFDKRLSEKQYHSLRFDFCGCGQSDGEEDGFTLASAAADLSAVYSWARAQGYTRFILISEGLGASLCALNLPEDAVSCIMLWPMLALPKVAQHVFASDVLDDGADDIGYVLKDKHKIGVPFIKELSRTNILPALQELKKPLMIMHGAKDEISPIVQIDMVRNHVDAARVEITSFQDGTHGLPDPEHRKMMFYHAMQFIEKYV